MAAPHARRGLLMAAPMVKIDAAPGFYRRGGRVVFPYRDGDGKQRWGSARNLAEAKRLKAKAITDVERGEWSETCRIPFCDYAAQWLDTYRGRTARGLSDTTRAGYRDAIERLAVPFFDRKRLGEIRAPDVRRYIAHLEAQGLAGASVRAYVAPLKALFATAVEDGALRANPTSSVRIVIRDEADDEPVRAMTREQLAAVLAAIPDEHRPFFELLAQTGVRISEAIGLQLGDVGTANGRPVLRVRRQCYRGNVKELKTTTGRRDVPLSPLMARRLWERQAKGDPDAPMFPTVTGASLDDSNMRKIVGRAATSAHAPWVTPHTFRHTLASLLFAEGRNAKQVAAWLGHRDPAFTIRTYIHLLDDGLGPADFLDDLTGANESANTPSRNEPNTGEVARVAFG